MQWSREGVPEAVKHLVKIGADANEQDFIGYTPIFCAAESGNLEVVNTLLAAGANPNAKLGVVVAAGTTPLMIALSHHRGAIGEEMAKSLIRAGADINARTNDGHSALMYAAGQGNSRAINVLVDAGADTTAVTDDGHRSSYFAYTFGHRRLGRYLKTLEGDVRGRHTSSLNDDPDTQQRDR
jgi:ankyrin repeat protein